MFCRAWSQRHTVDPQFEAGKLVHGSGRLREIEGATFSFGLEKMGPVPDPRPIVTIKKKKKKVSVAEGSGVKSEVSPAPSSLPTPLKPTPVKSSTTAVASGSTSARGRQKDAGKAVAKRDRSPSADEHASTAGFDSKRFKSSDSPVPQAPFAPLGTTSSASEQQPANQEGSMNVQLTPLEGGQTSISTATLDALLSGFTSMQTQMKALQAKKKS